MSKWVRRIAITLGVAVALVGALLLLSMISGDPRFAAPLESSAEDLEAAGIRFEQKYPAEAKSFRMKDGTQLAAQHLPAKGSTTVLYLHGILGASFLLNESSGLLREALGAEVVALDLRGHGMSGGKPGDTDYLGQYEDDVAEVVRQLRAERPGGRLILAGHSMGGGIALRYAEKGSLPPVDGYLLLAPHLGWKSPTTRKEASEADATFAQLHLPRLLALHLLNSIGVTPFNGLRIMFFNLPPELPLSSYTYRALLGGTPDDYREALAAVQVPLLLVAGSRDEAFVASEYEGVVRQHSRGSVALVPDATHNSLCQDPRAMEAIARWAHELP